MRALVAIANHGFKNRDHLVRLLEEYRSMTYKCDVVVLSDVPKHDLGHDVEVRVGRPLPDPWSLGYAHRPLFGERRDDYDLFIYSEDDTLLRESNIEAFLEATDTLEADEVAGFVRSETGPSGDLRYLDVHGPFRWLPESVRRRGGDTYARFSADHSACYVLTHDQLERAISSGGYLGPPHADRYDLLVAAATDPYAQCGFTKLVCVSRLPAFTVPHLSNRYAIDDELSPKWIGAADMNVLLAALADHDSDKWNGPLVEPETRLPRSRWSKDLYLREDSALVRAVPADARDVLVVGCGWGHAEAALVARGAKVLALPIDPVIGASSEALGIETAHVDLESAPSHLAGRSFDCIVFPDVLHLVGAPATVLATFVPLLTTNGSVVVSVPNLGDVTTSARALAGRVRSKERPRVVPADFAYRLLDDFELSGVQRTTTRAVHRWLGEAGLRVVETDRVVPARRQRYQQRLPQLADQFLADRLVVQAKRK